MKILRKLLPFLVFLVVAISSFYFRSGMNMDIVGGDAISQYSILTPRPFKPEASAFEKFSNYVKNTKIFDQSYVATYRPIAIALMVFTSAAWDKHSLLISISFALLNGLLAMVIFFLIKELSRSDTISLIGTFLSVCSTAYILGCWHSIFSVTQWVPLLFITSGLLAYFRYKSSKRKRWLLLYAILGFLGPWFREAPILLPILVIVYELFSVFQERKVNWGIFAISFFLLVHALYPMLIPKIVGINHGPVFSIFAWQAAPIKATPLAIPIVTVFWGRLFLEFPPLLWVLVIFSASFWALTNFSIHKSLSFLPRSIKAVINNRYVKSGSVALFVFLSIFPFYVIYSAAPSHLSYLYFMIFYIFLIVFTALRFGSWMAIWFAVTLFISLKSWRSHDMHLVFVGVSLSVVIASWIWELLLKIKSLRGIVSKVAIGVASVLLIISLGDQLSNVYASCSVLWKLNEGHHTVGRWLRDNVKKNSIVFGNCFPFEELWFKSDKWFQPIWIVNNIPLGKIVIPRVFKSDEFELNILGKISNDEDKKFISEIFTKNKKTGNYIAEYDDQKEYQKTTDIYRNDLLGAFYYGDGKLDQLRVARHAFSKGKDIYYLLLVTRNLDGSYYKPKDLRELQEFDIRQKYFYLDPLKVPVNIKKYHKFLGYSDWLTSYAFCRRTSPFVRQWDAKFVVYEYKGPIEDDFEFVVCRQDGMLTTYCVEETNRGYRILLRNGRYYAFPLEMKLNYNSPDLHKEPGVLAAGSLGEIEALIENSAMLSLPSVTSNVPATLVVNYKGYNIMACENLFYGVPQSLGPLDLSKEEDRSRKGIITGRDREKVEELIDRTSSMVLSDDSHVFVPILVSAYKGYNIVTYGDFFYGVPQSLGPLDLSKEKDRSRKGIIVGRDRKKVEELIDRTSSVALSDGSHVSVPVLIGAYKGNNIVNYGNFFYGVPQSLGSLDLSDKKDRNLSGILKAKDRNEAERLIDEVRVRESAPPLLVDTYERYNVVSYDGYYYGIPQMLGPLDVQKEEDRNREGILVSRDRDELKKLMHINAPTFWTRVKNKIRNILGPGV